MGDRTYHQGTIIASKPETVAALRQIVGDYVDDESAWGRLIEYTIEEAYLGTTVNEIVPAIREADPDAAFYCWEDPKYEFLGQVIISDGTDTYWADCGTFGAPLLTYAQVEYAMKHEGKTLDEAFGRPVIEGWNRAHDVVTVENGPTPPES